MKGWGTPSISNTLNIYEVQATHQDLCVLWRGDLRLERYSHKKITGDARETMSGDKRGCRHERRRKIVLLSPLNEF